MEPKQAAVSAQLRSPASLAVLAAVFAFLAAVTPVVRIDVAGMDGVSGVETGIGVAGIMAWVVMLAFAGAAAVRFIPKLSAYRDIVDVSAFVLLGAAIVWSFLDGPLVTNLTHIRQLMGGLGGIAGRPVPGLPTDLSVRPAIGLLFVVLAPLILLAARRRRQAL